MFFIMFFADAGKFVAGTAAYAKKRSKRLEKVMQYINTTENLTTADVVRFVMLQPDFHEDGLSDKELVG